MLENPSEESQLSQMLDYSSWYQGWHKQLYGLRGKKFVTQAQVGLDSFFPLKNYIIIIWKLHFVFTQFIKY